MKMTYTKNDLMNPAIRMALVAAFDKAKHGGFMRVNGFSSKKGYGEVSNYVYCKGISYPNAVEKSLSMLNDIIADPSFSIEVKRGTWQNANGEITPTNRKSKAFPLHVVLTKVYKHGDPAFEQALINIGLSLVAPKEATKEYKSLGNGIYEDENGTLFLRDLRKVSKDIIVKGEYPLSATSEENAIAKAIEKAMPIGNYRMFRLDATFESITLDGMDFEHEEIEETNTNEIDQIKEEVKELVTV